MKKTIVGSCIAIFFLILALNSWAQQTILTDVVYLKDGSIIRGIIIEQVPGKTLKVRTTDRSVFIINVEDVEKLVKEEVIVEDKEETARREAEQQAKKPLTELLEKRAFLEDSGLMEMTLHASKISLDERLIKRCCCDTDCPTLEQEHRGARGEGGGSADRTLLSL